MSKPEKKSSRARPGDNGLSPEELKSFSSDYERAFARCDDLSGGARAELARRLKNAKCQLAFEELLDDFDDLESVNFRVLWFDRLEELKAAECWWHYSVLKRKAAEYLKYRV